MSDLPLVLDLFSGTGSATQPFVECGKHRVVRIDIAGKPDIRADVRSLPLRLKDRPQFIWASPPCTEFSQLTNLAVLRGRRGPKDPEKGMETVRAAMSFIELADPENWLVENVLGAIPHISKEYGRPSAKVGAWALWGRCGFFMPRSNRLYKLPLYRTPHGEGKRIAFRNRGVGHGDKGSASRGIIPRPLAEAVHRAVCEP